MMRFLSFKILFLFLFLGYSPGLLAEDPLIPGVVSANKLNVRISPSPNARVVAVLDKGASVNVLRRQGEWFEIAAPASSSVWVASSFLKDGISIKEVKLRCGPSVAETSYKTIPPGTTLQVIDSSSHEAWTKVAVPPGLTSWVSAAFISLAPEDAAKLPAEKEPADDAGTDGAKNAAVPAIKSSDAPSVLNTSPSVGKDAKPAAVLQFIEDDVKTVSMEGILLPIAPDAVYVTHALAVPVKDEYFPVCYLHSSKLNLNLWLKRKVQLKGQQRWVKGWIRPVLEVDHITPIWQ